MRGNIARLPAIGLAAVALALGPVQSGATETVVLHAGSSIKAESVSPDGENYRILLPTLPGDPLLIRKSEVLCIGDACAGRQTAENAGQKPNGEKGGAPATRLVGNIGVSGSNTIGEKLMPELISAFGRSNGNEVERESDVRDESKFLFSRPGDQDPSASVSLFAHGSNNSIPDMMSGKALIGMRSSPVRPEDMQSAQHAGWKDLRDIDSEHVLAMDGLAVIVNPDNPVTALSTDQIAKIFSGKIANWTEVGGLPGPIDLQRRDDQSGTTDTFTNLVMKPSNEKISFTAKTFENSEELVNAVAKNKNAIGFVGWAYVGGKAHSLSIINSCGVPVKPSIFGIKTAEYPLSRRLFLYTNGSLTDPLAANLLSFALSDNANKVIDSNGFVSRRLMFLPFDQQVQRVLQVALARDPSPPDTRTFFKDVQSGQRASITFHFAAGTQELDAQGKADLTRLGAALAREEFQRMHFVIAGFASEREAPAAQLRALTQNRAAAITKALANEGARFFVENVLIKGYAAGAPVACDTTQAEQDLNSRVEVWMIDDAASDSAMN